MTLNFPGRVHVSITVPRLVMGPRGATQVHVSATVPRLVMGRPAPTSVTVMPLAGPQGPRGPAGDETGLGFVHSQTQPVTLVQVQHGFPFRPAGIDCIETAGDPPLLGVGVSHPALGITELTFGAPFTGTIYLS